MTPFEIRKTSDKSKSYKVLIWLDSICGEKVHSPKNHGNIIGSPKWQNKYLTRFADTNDFIRSSNNPSTEDPVPETWKYNDAPSIWLYWATSMFYMHPGNAPYFRKYSSEKGCRKKSSSCHNDIRFLSIYLSEYLIKFFFPKFWERKMRHYFYTFDWYDRVISFDPSSFLQNRTRECYYFTKTLSYPCICPFSSMTFESSFVRWEIWRKM
jgi:hypothetical protein